MLTAFEGKVEIRKKCGGILRACVYIVYVLTAVYFFSALGLTLFYKII